MATTIRFGLTFTPPALRVFVLMFQLLLVALLIPVRAPAPPAVYICQGSASYAYHRSAHCEGLAWCTSALRTLPVAAAQKLGRRPCGRCFVRRAVYLAPPIHSR